MDMSLFEIVYYATVGASILLLIEVLRRFGMFKKYFIEFTLLVIFYVIAAATVYNLGVEIW